MNSVLLVHPDEKIREAVGSILEQSGHAVTAAADGAGALDAFQRVRPDIVVLNRELPDLAGFKIFAEIRLIDPQAKVLVFAVRGADEKRTARPAFGVRAFKPGEVLDIIDELLNGSKRVRAQLERFAARILVVDDDLGVLDTLRRYLTDLGYEVAVAPGGMDALALLKKVRPHLVLLDIDMPGMNGVETLKRIRELDDQVGVMMITADAAVETMERCRAHGAYDYLIKPFDFRCLEFSVYSKILLMTL